MPASERLLQSPRWARDAIIIRHDGDDDIGGRGGGGERDTNERNHPFPWRPAARCVERTNEERRPRLKVKSNRGGGFEVFLYNEK